MYGLKLSFVGLIGNVAALFAIGRLDRIPFDPATTPTSLHIGTTALVIGIVVTRLSFRVPSTALVTAVAVVCVSSRAFVHDPDVLWTGSSALLTAIETVLASTSVLLAVRVARGLSEFEDSVMNITLEDVPRVMTMAEAREDIAIEMTRARRHQRPLTVTVLSIDPHSVQASLHNIVRDVQQRMMQRYIMSSLSRITAKTTRRGDIVVQDPAGNRVIVVSPESSPVQLVALTRRLQESAQRSLGIPIRFGSAGFPQTALTFDDLVARAAGDTHADAELVSGLSPVPEMSGRGIDGAPIALDLASFRNADDHASAQSAIENSIHALHGD